MKQSINPHCLYFQDYEIGADFRTNARTITEADLVMFSTLTGDMNPLHTDEEFSKNWHYGKRVCHGLLVVSFAVGLINKVGYVDGSTIALRQTSWQFQTPTFPGDTIWATVTVKNKRKLTDEAGIVNSEIKIFNQMEKICAIGDWNMMVALREEK